MKKSVWINILVLLLGIVVIYTIFSSKVIIEDNVEKESKVRSCSEIVSRSYRNECFYGIAVEFGDQKLCEKIYGNNLQISQCQSDIAIKMNDASICKEITSNTHRNKCYETIAIQTKDPSLCEKIYGNSLQVSECQKDVALG